MTEVGVGGCREEREKAAEIAKLKKRIGEQQATIAMFRGEGMSDTDQMLADMIATVQRMQAQIAVLEGAPAPAPPPVYPAPGGGGAQGPPAYVAPVVSAPEPAPSPPVVPAVSVGQAMRGSMGEAPQPFLVGGAAAMRPACTFAAKFAAGQRAGDCTQMLPDHRSKFAHPGDPDWEQARAAWSPSPRRRSSLPSDASPRPGSQLPSPRSVSCAHLSPTTVFTFCSRL
eukprot:COSAG04_NODE_3064_length_3214_cov_2.337400_3_plen_227_part_00